MTDSSIYQEELAIYSGGIGVKMSRFRGYRGQGHRRSYWEGAKHNEKGGSASGIGERSVKSKLDGI